MDPQIEKVLKLPVKQKAALLVFILLLEGAGLFYGLYKPKMEILKSLEATLEGLGKQIIENKKIADNLSRYKNEYEQLQKNLESALTELPNQKEIPSLLTSITNGGKSAGLDFLVFRPKPEVPKEFYAEVPVDISVAGSFYNVANFFVAVSKLPRIVNINNVNFNEIKNTSGKTELKVSCLATTFRFIDKKEIANDQKPKK